MNIKYRHKNQNEKVEPIAKIFDDRLDPRSGVDASEDAQICASRAASSLARLVEILAAKGLLNAKEILEIAGEASFQEPELLP